MSIEDEFDSHFATIREWADKQGFGLLLAVECPKLDVVYTNALIADDHPVLCRVVDEMTEAAEQNGTNTVQRTNPRGN